MMLMAKEKPRRGRPPKQPDEPSHTGRPVRIRHVFLHALDAIAERNGTFPPEEVNRALREYLQREGFWPPKE